MVESLTSAHWHHRQVKEDPQGSKGKQCSWHLSAHQPWKGPKGSGPHILCPSAFPLASLEGWSESVTTNVLWPSQAEEESLGLWDSVPLRTRAQLLGKRVGGNLHSSGGMKTPSELAQGNFRNWRKRSGLKWGF